MRKMTFNHFGDKWFSDVLRIIFFVIFVGVLAFSEEGSMNNHVRNLVNHKKENAVKQTAKPISTPHQNPLDLTFFRENLKEPFLGSKEVIEVNVMGYSRDEKVRKFATKLNDRFLIDKETRKF